MSKAFPIKDFPNYYITDTGDVYSRDLHGYSGRIKKLKPEYKRGYTSVTLCYNGKHIHKQIHRLVAEAFLSNPENKPQVNHKNGIRDDNCVENLEFVTRSENIRHSFDVLHRKPTWLGKTGKEYPNSKIVLQIKDNKVIAEFYGTKDAYRKTHISYGSISECCNGKRNHAGGFNWEYKQKDNKC